MDAIYTQQEMDEVLAELAFAVNEAEGWYDECRELAQGEEVEALASCYATLAKHQRSRLQQN